MAIHFPEARLGLIGAQSVRWPDRSTSLFWAAAHKTIEALISHARETDQKIDIIERSSDMSDLGKLRAMGDVAMKKIAQLNELPEYRKMKELADRDISMFERKKGELPQVKEDANAVAVAAQVREHLQGQGKPEEVLNYAVRYKGDPMVVAAIAGAPAFLSGLTDEGKIQFLREAEMVLWPDAVANAKKIQDALKHAEHSILQVKIMVGQRGQLLEMIDHEGIRQWDLKPMAKAA